MLRKNASGQWVEPDGTPAKRAPTAAEIAAERKRRLQRDMQQQRTSK